MPRMRHPNVEGAYDAHPDQVPSLGMSGWLTDEEWARQGLPEPPPAEDEPDEDTEQTKPAKSSRRARAQATSEKED